MHWVSEQQATQVQSGQVLPLPTVLEALSREVPGQVLVRIAIDDSAPITQSTFATLGFQGVTGDGRVTTLGRGGSDTSAVALAAIIIVELEKRWLAAKTSQH